MTNITYCEQHYSLTVWLKKQCTCFVWLSVYDCSSSTVLYVVHNIIHCAKYFLKGPILYLEHNTICCAQHFKFNTKLFILYMLCTIVNVGYNSYHCAQHLKLFLYYNIVQKLFLQKPREQLQIYYLSSECDGRKAWIKTHCKKAYLEPYSNH